MTNEPKQLVEAFHEDHRILGLGFHDLSTALRAKNILKARQVARELDLKAGAHIAFEEKVFYPRLVDLLGESEVRRLYSDHEEGLGVLERLLASGKDEHPNYSDDDLKELTGSSENMETHIAECGELFAAIGRMPEADQAELLKELLRLREEAPSWRSYAAEGVAKG